MKKRLLFMPALSLLAILPTAHSLADAINLSTGSHGVALDFQKDYSRKLSTRIALSSMPLDRTVDEEDVEYEMEYDRNNLGLLLDYHPFSGSFHLTWGLFLGDHNWDLDATSNDGEYEIGDDTYTSSNLKLKAKISWAKSAPYLGLGWGNTIDDGRFSANLDLGVLYVGRPDVNFEASGIVSDGTTTADVTAFPQFQENLELERVTLEDDMKKATVLPVIQLGFGIQF